jgi:hypothetical protein
VSSDAVLGLGLEVKPMQNSEDDADAEEEFSSTI